MLSFVTTHFLCLDKPQAQRDEIWCPLICGTSRNYVSLAGIWHFCSWNAISVKYNRDEAPPLIHLPYHLPASGASVNKGDWQNGVCLLFTEITKSSGGIGNIRLSPWVTHWVVGKMVLLTNSRSSCVVATSYFGGKGGSISAWSTIFPWKNH